MNQYQARKAIQQRWMTLWPGLSGNVPYVFDEDPFAETATYVRMSVGFDDPEQQTLGEPGSRRFERPGSIIVEIFAPTASGSMVLDQLTEHVLTIFEATTFGAAGIEEGIRCMNSTRGKPSSKGQHVTLSVGVDFEYFQVR